MVVASADVVVVDLVVAVELVSILLVVVVDTVVPALTSQFLIRQSSKGSQSNCCNSSITS